MIMKSIAERLDRLIETQENIGPNPSKHYEDITKEESAILDSLSDKDKYLRDRTIESNGKPIDLEEES